MVGGVARRTGAFRGVDGSGGRLAATAREGNRDRWSLRGSSYARTVLPVLVLLFVVMPLVELAVIVQVGQAIGVLDTVLLLLVVGVVGGWLVKREGVGVVRRLQATVAAGRMPATELVDAFLILFAGALLLAPGFLTDVFALALLVPPARAVIRTVLARRIAGRARREPPGVIDI